jgi:hypothetical protein
MPNDEGRTVKSLRGEKMCSRRFGRECLKAFLQYARPSPEGHGTIQLGISDPLGGQPQHDPQAAKRKMKDQPPMELE